MTKLLYQVKQKIKKKKEDEKSEVEKVYIPPEVKKLLMFWSFVGYNIKVKYQKLTNLPDKVPKFITKKWIKVYDQSNKANRI